MPEIFKKVPIYRHVTPAIIESIKSNKAIKQYGRSKPSNLDIRLMTATCVICREHSEWRKYDSTNLFTSEPTTACCKILSAKSYTSPDKSFGKTCEVQVKKENKIVSVEIQ